MLRRSPRKRAAIRAIERRARQRAGIAFDLTLRTNTRRLVSALRASSRAQGRSFPEAPTKDEIERELHEIVETLVARWIGPVK